MNYDEETFDARWDRVATDPYRKFEEIPEKDRLHPNRRICAFLKVYGLMKDPTKFDVCAEHDIIYLTTVDSLKEITDEDIVYLHRCGIFYDSNSDSLAMFC